MFTDFSDADLDRVKAEDSHQGNVNSVEYLRMLSNPADRKRAYRNGNLYMNLYGGNFSGSVYAAVRDVERYGERETPAERECREDQERTRKAREERFSFAALSLSAGLPTPR